MADLQARMAEFMGETGLKVGEIAKIARVSSSAVSQWAGLGKGKASKAIGKNVGAAVRLERKTGFNAAWLAEGDLPKRIHNGTPPPTLDDSLDELARALTEAPLAQRKAIAEDLAVLAVAPRDPEVRQRLLAALGQRSIAQQLLDMPATVESPRLPKVSQPG